MSSDLTQTIVQTGEIAEEATRTMNQLGAILLKWRGDVPTGKRKHYLRREAARMQHRYDEAR